MISINSVLFPSCKIALLEARGLPSHLFGNLGPRMHLLLQRTFSSSAGAFLLLCLLSLNIHVLYVSYNRGQNSLGHMSFAFKEAFPVRKLLPFTANAPFPPIAMLLAGRRHTCLLIYDIFISFQRCNGGWGDPNSKFPPKYKVFHEFYPRLQLFFYFGPSLPFSLQICK